MTVHYFLYMYANLSEIVYVFYFKCEVFGEIGEVINGRKEAHWEKTTVFKSVGKYYIFCVV